FWWTVPSGLRSKKQPSSFSSSWMRSTASVTSFHASSWCGSHLPPSIVSMKWRSTESSAASATLKPPCTMRVQPHLPSRPFTATAMRSSGSALCAWSAAKRPAPPDPRIRMSVSSVRTSAAEAEELGDQDVGHHGEAHRVSLLRRINEQEARGDHHPALVDRQAAEEPALEAARERQDADCGGKGEHDDRPPVRLGERLQRAGEQQSRAGRIEHEDER